MSNIIEVFNLKKSYQETAAVKDLSFTIKKGELFSLLGPNGAGKSTTIDILCTLLKPDGGEVKINGFRAGKEDLEIKNDIGIVFQDSILDASLTVRENLYLRSKFYIKKKSRIQRAVHEAALAVSAMEYIDRPYGKLSGGQRRRADIARAMVHTPSVLFLDEPTAGLDPQVRHDVWEMILRLKEERNMTILLTTHYMEEAAVSDRIIMLDHGLVAAGGTPMELKEKYQVNTLDEVFLKVAKREEVLSCRY